MWKKQSVPKSFERVGNFLTFYNYKKNDLYSYSEILKKEMNEIIGKGNQLEHADFEDHKTIDNYLVVKKDDIVNSNSIDFCLCKYNNKSGLTNSNSATVCNCQCI